jgi:hypothetical protein
MQGFLPVGGNSLTLNALGYKVPVRRLPPDVEKWLSSKPKAAARFRATGCGSRGAQAWHLLTVVLVAGLQRWVWACADTKDATLWCFVWIDRVICSQAHPLW